MECEKNPFLEMSQDQIKKLDEALQSEHARALLEESSVKLFESSKPVPIVSNSGENDDSIIISSSMESLSGLSDIESLVLGSSSAPGLFTVPNVDEVVSIDSVIFAEDLNKTVEPKTIMMDHSYSLPAVMPKKPDQKEAKSASVADQLHAKEITNKHVANQSSAIRRSRRQMERTERGKNKFGESDTDDEKNSVFEVSSSTSQDEEFKVGDLTQQQLIISSEEDVQGKKLNSLVLQAEETLLQHTKGSEKKDRRLKPLQNIEVEPPGVQRKGSVSPKKEPSNSQAKQRKLSETPKSPEPPVRKGVQQENTKRRSRSESSVSSEVDNTPTSIKVGPKTEKKDTRGAKRPVKGSPQKQDAGKIKNSSEEKLIKVVPSKSTDKKTLGKKVEQKPTPPNKRKQNLSFSEALSECITPVPEKKRLVTPRTKKRLSKSDSLSVEILGPALFSDPHIICKKKEEEQAVDEPVAATVEMSEIDLIKAELELEDAFKSRDVHDNQELNVARLEEDAHPISNSKQLASQICSTSESDQREDDPDRTGKSEKFAKKPKPQVESPQPERKSQRTVQKKKRIYEDESPERSPANKRGSAKKDQPKKGKSPRRDEKISKRASDYSDDHDDSDLDSEDDPEKLWCICRKPHNNKFMIQCDKCEDWFHGSCVGITRQQGRVLEKQEKDWVCPKCVKGSNAKSSQPLAKSNKTAADQMASIKKGTAVDSAENDAPVAFHTENFYTKKLDQAIKNVTPSHSSPEISKVPSSPSKKEKIEKRLPKDNVTKGDILRKIPIKKEIVSRKELGIEKLKGKLVQPKQENDRKMLITKSIKTESSHTPPLRPKPESSSTAKPGISNKEGTSLRKEKTLKDEFKRHPPYKPDKTKKLEKVLSKTFKDNSRRRYDCTVCNKPAPIGSVYCNDDCLERYVADSVRMMLEQKGFLKGDEDWKTKKVVVIDRQTGNLITGNSAPDLGDIVVWLKSNPSFEIVRPSIAPVKKEHPKVEKKLQLKSEDGESAGKEGIRQNVRKTLKKIFLERCQNADDLDMKESTVQHIVQKIEEELHEHFNGTGVKYRTKYMSLMFNIKDPRNQGLFRNILKGEITPDVLVRMSTDGLASSELAKWREKENQHSLDMIKRMQIEQQRTPAGLRKKTHKGEIEIEGDNLVTLEQAIEKDIRKTPPMSMEETIEVTPEKKEREKEIETENDTTPMHRSHLFDLNCKICTGKMAPPPPDETAPKKIRVARSISIEPSAIKSNEVPDLIHIPMTKRHGHRKNKEIPENSTDKEPTSTTQSPPDSSTRLRRSSSKTSKSQMSVWKGFIMMPEVTKFFAMAYKVSGHTDFLYQDLPDTIPVCGRISPDQVWDYLSKIKQSGNKELIVIRFSAPSAEESVTYNSFYKYLDERQRFGVVNTLTSTNTSSKMVKDFYILPLSAHSKVPTVLMPFDGPGLPPRRPHLLLGVLVRHKTRQAAILKQSIENKVESAENERSYTPPLASASYTPPLTTRNVFNESEISSSIQALLPNSSSESTPTYMKAAVKRSNDDDNELYEPSYTPPLEKMPRTDSKDEDDMAPYDPEQNIHSISAPEFIQQGVNVEEDNRNTISKLFQKIAEASIPSTTRSLLPLEVSDLEREKVLLDELSRKYQETSRKVDQSLSDLKQLVSASASHEMQFDVETEGVPSSMDTIPGICESGMTSFLDLPSNLQDILNAVQQKPLHEYVSPDSIDVDMRVSNEIPLLSSKDTDIRTLITSFSSANDENKENNDLPSQPNVPEEPNSQGGTPPLCDEEDNTNSELQRSDPRIKLRTNFSSDTYAEAEPRKMSLSDMSTIELMERAQKELEAIEAPAQKQPSTGDSSLVEPYHSSWETSKEPLPPGEEPPDFPPMKSGPLFSTEDAVLPPGFIPAPPVAMAPPSFSRGGPLGGPPPFMPPMMPPEDRPYPPEGPPGDWREGPPPPHWDEREWQDWSKRMAFDPEMPPEYYREQYEEWRHSHPDHEWYPEDYPDRPPSWRQSDYDSRYGRPRHWQPRHPRGNRPGRRMGFPRKD